MIGRILYNILLATGKWEFWFGVWFATMIYMLK